MRSLKSRGSSLAYLVVDDVIEQVDEQHDLFLVRAEVLSVLSGRSAEQYDNVGRSGHHWADVAVLATPLCLLARSRQLSSTITATELECRRRPNCRRVEAALPPCAVGQNGRIVRQVSAALLAVGRRRFDVARTTGGVANLYHTWACARVCSCVRLCGRAGRQTPLCADSSISTNFMSSL